MGAYYVNGGVGNAAAAIQALGAWPSLHRPPVASPSAASSLSAAAAAAASFSSSAAASAAASSASASTSFSGQLVSGDHLQPMATATPPGVIENMTSSPYPTLTTLLSPPTGPFHSADTTVAAASTVATTATTTTTTTTAAVAVQGSLSGSEKSSNINAIGVVEGIERMIGSTWPQFLRS